MVQRYITHDSATNKTLGVIPEAQTTHNGLEDPSKFTCVHFPSSRTFRVTYSTGAAVWVNGIRYAKSGNETTSAHSSTTGKYYFYYNSSGVLTQSTSAWDLLITSPLAVVYYNDSLYQFNNTQANVTLGSTYTNNGNTYTIMSHGSVVSPLVCTGTGVPEYSGTLTLASGSGDATIAFAASGPLSILVDERHPAFSGMDNATHKNLHLTRGTQTVSGFSISGYTLNTTGSGLQYAVASGVIADEDLFLTASAMALGGPYRIFRLSGAGAGSWVWESKSLLGVVYNATSICYNNYTGSAWAVTPVSQNNRWINYYVVALTDLDGTKRIAVVMGQTLFTSLASAQADDPSVSISNLSSLTDEFVHLYRLTYKTSATTDGYVLASVQGLRSNTISVTGGFSSSDHQSLSNRSAIAAHPGTSVELDTSGFTTLLTPTETNTQLAFNKLNNHTHPNAFVDQLYNGGTDVYTVAAGIETNSVLDLYLNGLLKEETRDWTKDAATDVVTLVGGAISSAARVRIRKW